MRSVIAIRLALGAIVLTLVATATALGNTEGSTVASRLAGIAGPGSTGIQLVNLSDSDNATFGVDLYNQDGRAAVRIVPPPVAPGAGYNVYLPAESRAARGSAFAVLTEANQPFAQIARTEWYSTGAATMYESADASLDVVVPWVVRDAGGASTLVSIQNTDTSQAASVSATWYDAAGQGPIARDLTIGRGTSATLDLRTDSVLGAVPGDADGYLRVTADRPVAVHAFADYPASVAAVSAFNGVPTDAAGSELYAPLLASAAATGKPGRLRTTQVHILNPGSTTVDVTLDYSGIGACAGASIRHSGQALALGAGQQLTLDQAAGGGSGLSAGCTAAGLVTATGPVVAVVSEVASEPDVPVAEAAAYTLSPATDAGERILLPMLRYEHTSAKLGTAVTVQNAGTGPAAVQLSLLVHDGTAVSCGTPCSVVLAAGHSHTFDMATTGYPANMYGSGSLNADQPLAVVVHDRSRVGIHDVSVYRGIIRPGAGASAGPPQALPLVLNNVEWNSAATATVGTPGTATVATTPPPPPTRAPGGKVKSVSGGLLLAALGEQTVSATVSLQPHVGGTLVTLPPITVIPGAMRSVYLPAEASAPRSLLSGVVNADGPLAGVNLMDWVVESAIVNVEAAAAGTDLVLPLVAKDLSGRDTFVALQNLSAAPVTVTLTVKGGNGVTAASASRTLRAAGATLIDLGRDADFAALPLGFVGSLRATSASPIALSALVDEEHSAMAIYGFNGAPAASAGEQLWVPRVQANVVLDPAVPAAGAGHTVVAVANPGSSTVAFSLDYLGIEGPCTGQAISGQSNQVAGGGMIEVDVSLDGLPAGCSAAARVTAAAPVLAVVVDTVVAAGRVRTGMAYNALRQADTARRVVLPLVRRQHPQSLMLSTDLAVQNTGAAAATVSLTLTQVSGNGAGPVTCQAGCSATIEPGATFVFQPEAMDGLAVGAYGGGVLTSTQPLAVVTLQQSRLLRYDSSAFIGSPADLPRAAEDLNFPLMANIGHLRDPGPSLAPLPPPGEEQPSPGPLAGVRRLSRVYLPWILRPRQ
jgi:hypothetical protein